MKKVVLLLGAILMILFLIKLISSNISKEIEQNIKFGLIKASN